MALLQHAVEVGAQVGHRGEAFIEAHDAATVLPVRDQSLPQLHEEIQPRKIAGRITVIELITPMIMVYGTHNYS